LIPPVTIAQQPAPNAAALQQANTDLNSLAQELATLLAEPGFRGFLRSEIAKSKNRENIVELDKFLDKAARQQGAPKGLAKYRDRARGIDTRIKNSHLNALAGFDLYIPVDAHRKQWKGGKDFLVAASPLGDEKNIRQIVAYSVQTGKQVMLDPNTPPQQTVLVLVPEEHDTHEMPKHVMQGEPMDPRRLPPPSVSGRDPAHKPVPQDPGNSYIGVRRLYIRDVKEPWTRGAPEIKAFFGQRKGNYCEERYVSHKYTWLDGVNKTKTWYNTWPVPHTSNCNSGPSTNSTSPCWYFDNNYYDKGVLYIYEQDGGDHKNTVYTLYPGVTCSFSRYSGDDYVDGTSMYKSNMPFEYDYKHDLGNAYVIWHKLH
jgi:hypothetical protein